MRTALLTDSDMYIEMIFQATMRLCLKEKWSLDSVLGDHFEKTLAL